MQQSTFSIDALDNHTPLQTGSQSLPMHQTVTTERLMSSSVIGEEILQTPPQEQVTYKEVPVIEEKIRYVKVQEVRTVEKKVPRYEIEWVEKIVEIPEIQYVDKHVEVPHVQEIVKHVPVKQVVEVPKEVVKYVPRIETKIVEKEVEVVGETIELPKPYLVENKVIVPRYIDKEVPTVVAQRMQPVITESETDFVDVELKEYNPQLIPVDVYIPRPVTRNLIAASKYEEHRVVDVPPAQYNALISNLNTHLTDKDTGTMYVKLGDGTIPMLHGLGSSIVPPTSNEWEKFHTKGQTHVSYASTSYVGAAGKSSGTTVSFGPTTATMAGAAAYPTSSSGGYTLTGSTGFTTRGLATSGGVVQQQIMQQSTPFRQAAYSTSQTYSAGMSTSYQPRTIQGTTTSSAKPVVAGA